ncbi:MAG: Gfo/Idh/MocA family oxidoreductase [Pseudomonadales bacterium]|uniref:Gfo/Idh/MocA-like oxidoreductase N-terminal domain-containing protein n=1 Tax=marine metagenome TaxID=408172 RepID=A0A381VVF3_9ZZZZ|nr:Gfo/Idh/MocA family oxidoreductase [Pseudomonadales bacterium]MEC9240553.1 Gfo/Idh/MocA family oxidoreductase [Pseudomonadota bacterium]MED5555312.1 Gfo/Idh/MocA family oxidoreductase [Pseudomonadota bacterium]
MTRLRMGLVGGGEGAFIGAVHRIAAELDGRIELVCGAFSSDPSRSKRFGQELYDLPPGRSYGTFNEMVTEELRLPTEERMHFVVIATPNHLHFPVAESSLQAGFHVVSDKPVTFDLGEARTLRALAAEKDLLFGLTHNYTGYPMVKEARELIKAGALGSIRRVIVEYIQGWLAERLETQGNKQAIWRTDPRFSGSAGCMGDIGTHGENLLEYVTGLEIDSLCADLTTFVPGRLLEDDGNVLLRFSNGARGVLLASQIAVGEENGLKLRVYGERASLEWVQTDPNSLVVRWPDRPFEVRRTGGPGVSEAATAATRLPAGHPEGFLEAFALLYRNFAAALEARLAGRDPTSEELDFPTIDDGVRGMAFIDAVVDSSKRGGVWTDFPNWN